MNEKEAKMEKDFFDVFPNLKIKDPLQELLDMVVCHQGVLQSGQDQIVGLYQQ